MTNNIEIFLNVNISKNEISFFVSSIENKSVSSLVDLINLPTFGDTSRFRHTADPTRPLPPKTKTFYPPPA